MPKSKHKTEGNNNIEYQNTFSFWNNSSSKLGIKGTHDHKYKWNRISTRNPVIRQL